MRQYKLNSDLVLAKPIVPLVYKQYDNGDKLEIEFYNDSDKITLTTEKVMAFFELEEGVVVQKNCSIVNGNAVAILDNNILSKNGKIKAEFTIYDGERETTTKTILITIEASINRNEAITTVPKWDIVQQMLEKSDIIDSKISELEAKKNEAITIVNKIKEDTIVQLNATTQEVRTLKEQTIEESTVIKNSAIGELSKIKTDSITALEQIKADSITELNSIKDIANTDLEKVKIDTIAAVTTVAQEAIDSINKYNIQDVSSKLDTHTLDTNIHVTKELKDSITLNTTRIETLEQGGNLSELTGRVDTIETSLKDSQLTSFKTDVLSTPLMDCAGGFVNIDGVQGKTRYMRADGTITDVWEAGVRLVSVGEPVRLVDNLFNKNNITLGSFYHIGGDLIQAPVLCGTEFIAILPNTDYVQNRQGHFTFWDKDKKYISGVLGYTAKSPINAAYMTSATEITNIDSFQIQKGTTLSREFDYRIEILSSNENFFGEDLIRNYILTKVDKNEYSLKYKDMTGISLLKDIYEKDTVYTFSYFTRQTANNNARFRFVYTDGSSEDIASSFSDLYGLRSKSSNASKTLSYISTTYHSTTGEWFVKNICLRKGSSTEYIENASNKTEILTTQPLRGIPNVIQDSIDANGVITRNCIERVYNGSENWECTLSGQGANNINLTTFRVACDDIMLAKNMLIKNTLSTVIPSIVPNDWNSNIEGIYSWDTFKFIYANISNTKTGIILTDSYPVRLQKFKTWLASNSTTVAYQLATSTIESSNKTLNLEGYENGSLIVNSGVVQPYVEGTYSTNTGERISSIEEAIEGIDNQLEGLWNIAKISANDQILMKTVANLTPTSTLIDVINKINEILNILKS